MLTAAQRLRRLAQPSGLKARLQALHALDPKSSESEDEIRSLWERYAPAEWQDECPHYVESGIGQQLPWPYGLDSFRLEWILANVQAVKMAQTLVRESASRWKLLDDVIVADRYTPQVPEHFVWVPHDFKGTLEHAADIRLLTYTFPITELTRDWQYNSWHSAYPTIASTAVRYFSKGITPSVWATSMPVLQAELEKFLDAESRPKAMRPILLDLARTVVDTDEYGDPLEELDPDNLPSEVEAEMRREFSGLDSLRDEKESFANPFEPLVHLAKQHKVVTLTACTEEPFAVLAFPMLGEGL